MKKTNVLFSFLVKGKALMLGGMLTLAFICFGTNAAHAQLLTPKNATPLQMIQQELTLIQDGLATIQPNSPKALYYAPYVTYLQTLIQKLNSGMSFHAAVATSRQLMPTWVNHVPGTAPSPVIENNLAKGIAGPTPTQSVISSIPKN